MFFVDRKGVPVPPRMFDTPTVLFLVAALLFLYCYLFIPPFLPIDHSGDYVIFITSAKRMYEGEVMYRDFFEFLTPGTPFFFYCLFKLFGPRLWIPNLVLLLLGVSLTWIALSIAKKLMSPKIAFLSSAILLVGVYKNYLDPTHHWFSLLTAMAAVAVLLDRRTPTRIAVAGFFCGLTVWFTQSRGLAVIAGLGLFLCWESWRKRYCWREWLKKEAWLVGSLFATLVASNAYFAWKAGPTRFLWCTVIYVMRYWPKFSARNTVLAFVQNLPDYRSLASFHFSSVEWLFIYGVIPLVYILFFVRYRQGSHKMPTEFWERPMLLALVGSFMLLFSLPTPSPFRMTVSELPGILLLGWFIDSPRKVARALASVIAAGILLVTIHAFTRAQPKEMNVLATPQGALAVTDHDAYEEYSWVQQHTQPLDYFFAVNTNIYFYLNLRDPIPTAELTNSAYTTQEQVSEAIRDLRQHRPHYIMWSPEYLDAYTKWQDPSEDHLGPLRDYLHAHYSVTKVFSNSNEIWESRH
ncbi:MAG: hypothetical protein ACLQVG_29730 [Terriglobia bacterium]